jgi:hypothetical protein
MGVRNLLCPCLFVTMAIVCATLTIHFSFIPCPNAPPFSFSTLFMNAFYLTCNFEYNEKWQGSEIFKKLKNLMTACNYNNCKLNAEKTSIPQLNSNSLRPNNSA